MSYKKLGEIDQQHLLEYIRKLTIFTDHCKRAQIYFEDYMQSRRGLFAKLRDFLTIKPRVYTFSFCQECFDIESELLLSVETLDIVKSYGQEIKKMQESCMKRECKEAFNTAEQLKEKILKEYF